MKALVLAAGKGTRLGSLTANVPKPMLPVGDRPLLAYTVEWLKRHDVHEIAINLHHAAPVITGFLGDGSQYGVEITYSFESRLLGTAGAAKQLESFLDEQFVVVYGDVFTNVNLTALNAFHREHLRLAGSPIGMTMSLYRVPDPTACGIVALDDEGRIVRFLEKPTADEVFSDLANSGILVCEPAILGVIPACTEYDFGRDVLPRLLDTAVPVFGQPIGDDEYVIDIGTPSGYLRAQSAIWYAYRF